MAARKVRVAGANGRSQGQPREPPPPPPLNQPRKSRSSRIAEISMTWLFRLFTVVSISYLVYDRYYETNAIITSSASDPANPFFFPFSLTNSSHLFHLKNIDWACQLVRVDYEGNGRLNGPTIIDNSQKSDLAPGQVTNIFCNRNGIQVDSKVIDAVVRMQANYDVDVFGIFNLHRQSDIVTFNWLSSPTEARRQWLKGEP